MKKLNLLLVLLLILSLSCSKDDEFSGKSGTFTDSRDGWEYKWVKIGDQIWMAENLRATKLNDGTSIPNITNDIEWENISTPAYRWYNNDEPQYSYTYGPLYNGFGALTGKLCPAGWHVPSYVEWQILVDYLGGIGYAGGKLKETGITHWNSPNTGATNESGFTALPSGVIHNDGGSAGIGVTAAFYTITERQDMPGYYKIWYLTSDAAGIYGEYYAYPSAGYSVRCIKD